MQTLPTNIVYKIQNYVGHNHLPTGSIIRELVFRIEKIFSKNVIKIFEIGSSTKMKKATLFIDDDDINK